MDEDEFMRKVRFEFGYTFEQAKELWEIARACGRPAMLVGGTTGAVGAIAGGTVSFGTLTLPMWAVGFLGGFISGEIACVAGGAEVRRAFDALLKK